MVEWIKITCNLCTFDWLNFESITMIIYKPKIFWNKNKLREKNVFKRISGEMYFSTVQLKLKHYDFIN